MNKNHKIYQYLLFIFGDFTDKDKIIELIATQLSSFTDKNTYLKYNYGDYGIVMNFQSQFSFVEIREHTQIILEKVAPQYFLMEHPNNLYAFMPSELKINLFDLNHENHNVEDEKIKNELNKNIFDNFLFTFSTSVMSEDMLSEEQMENLFNDVMLKYDNPTYIKKEPPTMDELLEKIKENGLNSLTETEKQILDEYSKS